MYRFLCGISFCFYFLLAFQVIADNAMAASALPEPAGMAKGATASAAIFSHGSVYHSSGLGLELGLAAGVRVERFTWSIAGSPSGANPNILSELEWSDVISHQLTLNGRARMGSYVYGRGQANFAWIDSGTVRDSDYAGDNRTSEYSRSVSETNGDHLWDLSAGLGYPFSFPKRHLFFAPLAGVSFHRQLFRITNGQQVISEDRYRTPAIGPLDSRLNSHYAALWRTLWIGCDLRYEIPSSINLPPPMAWELSLKYFVRADYSAKADWNLRGDLQHPVSFEHDAQGNGFSVQFLWLIRLGRRLDMNLTFHHSRMETGSGTDTIYRADGQVLTTRLNEVLWQSNSVMLGLAYRF